jgi:hypothetical protein
MLAPLDRRVNSVVNYDGFKVGDEVAWMDAVNYVQERWHLNIALHQQRVPAPQARRGPRGTDARQQGVRERRGGRGEALITSSAACASP